MNLLIRFLPLLLVATAAAHAEGEWNPDITYPALSPADEIKTIEVPKGTVLTCIASEPMVEEPTAIAFDGNGALYVCEWRTYMQDEYGTDQLKPISRVVKLVDTDGDGVMDKRTVFIDNAVLPRAVLPLHDRVLVHFTHDSTIWSYFDDNKDGVADRREVAWQGTPNNENVEFQQNALLWNLDNTICTNDRRFRWDNGKLHEMRHDVGRLGQYGLARDDDGRLVCSYAGGGNPAHSFQLPAGYPILQMNEHAPGYERTWGICPVWDDSDGGYDVARKASLLRFTASCGQTVLRSSVMPQWYGNAVTCEPVGRLLRMTRFEWKDGAGMAHNAFPESEFVRSTDGYFRPVWTENGPDGGLYIADMYRGILQEKEWFPTTSTPRYTDDFRKGKMDQWVERYQRVKKWGMIKVVRHGRIHRLLPENAKPAAAPKMLDETAVQLVAHLAHPSGWWRDTAQALIVSRGDMSAVPALLEMAGNHASENARIHALWALQGLDALPKSLVLASLKHEHPRVRRAAVQLAEKFLLEQDAEILASLTAVVSDPDAQVATQVFLAFRAAGQTAAIPMPAALIDPARSLPLVAKVLAKDRDVAMQRFSETGRKGKQIYESLCIACHGPDGNGVLAGGKLLAPPLSKSAWFADGGNLPVLARIVLKGQTGPINGASYGEGLMVPLENTYDDEQISQVLSYVGERWHGWARAADQREIASVRKEIAQRPSSWTHDELVKWQQQQKLNFHPIAIDAAATADGRQGVYQSLDAASDHVSIKKYGEAQINGVPFTLLDPASVKSGKNVIVLKGGMTANVLCKTFPQSVEILVNQPAGRLHLLGGVAGWGWPVVAANSPGVDITVRYEGGESEQIALLNGVDIADHIRVVEVPGSVLTSVVERGQMRYLWRNLKHPGRNVISLTIASYDNQAAPMIAALTMESADKTGVMAPAPVLGGPVNAPTTELPEQPVAGKLRVLLAGGGASHDFSKWFDLADQQILQDSGRCVTFYTNDPKQAQAQLARADVFLLSANDAHYQENADFRKALESFTQKGGGLVLLHPATWYNWATWREYNMQYVAGGANAHDTYGEFGINVLRHQHPVMAGLPASFTLRDELYHVKLSAAPGIEILAETSAGKQGEKYPSIWLPPHPKARIVCLAPGHDAATHEDANFKRLLLNAVVWSSGK